MRTNSGGRGAGVIASGLSSLGLIEEGNRAILNYQWTACDLPHDLIVGLAQDQTVRFCRWGTLSFGRRRESEEEVNV